MTSWSEEPCSFRVPLTSSCDLLLLLVYFQGREVCAKISTGRRLVVITLSIFCLGSTEPWWTGLLPYSRDNPHHHSSKASPLVIFGVFGLPSSWLDVLSLDLNIGGLMSRRTIASYVSIFGTFLAVVRPTIPFPCPSWLHKFFPLVAWSLYGDNATMLSGEGGGTNGSSSETFVYVNGICTTKQMAQNTCNELSTMFQRDVIGVHNPTDSIIVDLLECILGKLWIGESVCVSEPVKLVYEEVKKALQDPNKTKVVLISHSQGTIIAGDVLWKLWSDVDNGDPLLQTAMNRLEIYAVANASQYMEQREGFPYIESICNNYDNVGMLGANAPAITMDRWRIRIDGRVIFPTRPKWGHMISSHYLQFLKEGDYPDSKLHDYIVNAVASEN